MFDTLSRLERRRQRNPGIPLFARIAEEYLNRGDLDRALELCREGCEQFPAYPIGFSIRSRCLEAAGELEEARAALDMSLRLDPNNPGGFARLSDLYLQLGVETLAVKCLEHAASLDPFDLDLAARAAELAQSVEGADSDGAARDLPVAPQAADRHADRDTVETTGEEPDEEAVGEETAAVDSVGTEEAEEREGAFAVDSSLEETLASSFDETIVGAIDEDGSPGGLDPQGSEPFAAVEPMPEWAELEAIEEDPEPPPAEPLRQRDGKSGGYDEVAALGAELFGEDALADMGTSAPGPPPQRRQEAAPPGPADLSEDESGDDLSVETVGLEPEDDVSALLTSEDIFGGDEIDDDEYIGDEELIGGPVEAPDVGGEEERIADETVVLDEDEIFAEQSSGSEVLPAETVSTEETVSSEETRVSQPLPAEEIVPPEGRPVPEPVPTAAADHAALEPELPVSRLSTRDDTELLELFRAIGSPPPVAPAASSRAAAAADVEAEPVPTVTLAELYAQQGFAERAMVTYRQILAIEPDNEEVKSKLSMLERSW